MQSNVDFSKIKEILALKGIFSETKRTFKKPTQIRIKEMSSIYKNEIICQK